MRTIIVTGANRGIGRAICQSLLTHPSSITSPLILYATSRSGTDLNLSPPSNASKIIYHPLDITDPTSISALKSKIKSSTSPTVDILINNAGVNLDNTFTAENAYTTINVNYRGTLAMSRAIIPLMQHHSPPARIVSLSSIGSSLAPFSPSLQSRFRTVQTIDDVDALAAEYIWSIGSPNPESDTGWPAQRSYSVSKALINAMTIVLARENPDVLVNCCCPGWVNTEMGNLVGRPPKTEEEGARVPVRLAVGEDMDGVSGRYWANASMRSRGEGEVQVW